MPKRRDLRIKVRLRPSGSLMVFALDASDSMSVQSRMLLAKGAVMALLLTAQVTGDRVALVAFQGDEANVVLHPTASLARARARLRRLPTGGATPLASGLHKALEVIRAHRRRDPMTRPRLVLCSDGDANVPRASGGDIETELQALAKTYCREDVTSVVLDTNPPFESSKRLRSLADDLGAAYHQVHALDAEDLSELLRG